MSDLEKIEADLEKVKALANAEKERVDELAAENRKRDAKENAQLLALKKRLGVFQESVKGKVPVHIRESSGSLRSLHVIIGWHPIFAKPVREFTIRVHGIIGRGFSGNYLSPRPNRTEGETITFYEKNENQVIDLISEASVQYLNKNTNISEWHAPVWYDVLGRLLGGIGFVGTWIILCFGGLWGVLLGWIPAGIVYMILRPLWGIALILGLLFLSGK